MDVDSSSLSVLKRGEGDDLLPLLNNNNVNYGLIRFPITSNSSFSSSILSTSFSIASFGYIGDSISVLDRTRHLSSQSTIKNTLDKYSDFHITLKSKEIPLTIELMQSYYLSAKQKKRDEVSNKRLFPLDCSDGDIKDIYSSMHDLDLPGRQWMLFTYDSENESKLKLIASGINPVHKDLEKDDNEIIKSINDSSIFFLYMRVDIDPMPIKFILCTIRLKSDPDGEAGGSDEGAVAGEGIVINRDMRSRSNSNNSLTPLKRRASMVQITAKLTLHKSDLNKAFHSHHEVHIESKSTLKPSVLMTKVRELILHKGNIYIYYCHIYIYGSNRCIFNFAIGYIYRVVLVEENKIHEPQRVRIPEDGQIKHLKEAIEDRFKISYNLQLLCVLRQSTGFSNHRIPTMKILDENDKTQLHHLGLSHGDKLYVECLRSELERTSTYVSAAIMRGSLGSLGVTRRNEGLNAIRLKELEFSTRISKLKSKIETCERGGDDYQSRCEIDI